MLSLVSRRYRLCGTHLYTPEVRVAGSDTLTRFCQVRAAAMPFGRKRLTLPPPQKCCCLQELNAFMGTQRTCTAQLEVQRNKRSVLKKAVGRGTAPAYCCLQLPLTQAAAR